MDKKFKEKAEYADALIEEVKEKLGDDAGKVSEQLLGLRATITEATEIHNETVGEKEKVESYNKELLTVNNNLFIKGSQNIRGDKQEPDIHNDDDDDDENPLADYLELATKGKGK